MAVQSLNFTDPLENSTGITTNFTNTMAIVNVGWTEQVLVPVLFAGPCFLFGILGNGLVIWTILMKIHHRSVTLLLILNLALADFLALLTLPFFIHSVTGTWSFGLTFCKLIIYVFYFTTYASINFIMLTSLHRCLVVLYPFASRQWQKKRVVYGIMGAIWLVALGSAIPFLSFISVTELDGKLVCPNFAYDFDKQSIPERLVETILGFIIPLGVLLICYSFVGWRIHRVRSPRKNKTGKLIAAVIVVFCICWSPLHILNILTVSVLLLESSNRDYYQALQRRTESARHIAIALAYLSNCLNPLLYAFAAHSFQGGFRETNFAKLFGQMDEDEKDKLEERTPQLESQSPCQATHSQLMPSVNCAC